MKINFGIDFSSKRARIGSDPSKRVGKDDIPTLESELLAAEESLNDISREIEFARKQEILLTQATGKSNCIHGFMFLFYFGDMCILDLYFYF